jgi:hypothetical protein
MQVIDGSDVSWQAFKWRRGSSHIGAPGNRWFGSTGRHVETWKVVLEMDFEHLEVDSDQLKTDCSRRPTIKGAENIVVSNAKIYKADCHEECPKA